MFLSRELKGLAHIASTHHERLDGSGYPLGLTDKNLSKSAKILAVADVFDALASKRPYKEAWSIDEAFAELKRISGEELDSDCVDALLKNREAIERIQTLFVDPE